MSSNPIENHYMYSTAYKSIEVERLAILNSLHNPHTLSFLEPYLSKSQRILEIGRGSGQLAYEVMSKANKNA